MGRMLSFDLAVIGGGPAGLMAACTAAERGRTVVVLEYLPSPGRKLLASGAGKCNLTNVLEPDEMAARFACNAHRILPALRALPPSALRRWFARRGVSTGCKDGFHYFPVSERARDVLEALLAEAQRHGVRFYSGSPVRELLLDGGAVAGVRTDSLEIRAPRVLVATGGNGYPALGGRGSGYELARQAGHAVLTPVPALVGLRTAERWPAELAGLVLEDAAVRLGPKASGRGELLFTHTGVSGPAVLDLSGRINRRLLTEKQLTLSVNLIAERNAEFWKRELLQWSRSDGRKQLGTLLARHFSRQLAERLCGISGNCAGLRAAGVPGGVRDSLIANLTKLPLAVTGSDGWEKAMATDGGVPLDEINPRTMASRLCAGLYFAGEMLAVGAPCGGYNLQWAFSSGFTAGSNS